MPYHRRVPDLMVLEEELEIFGKGGVSVGGVVRGVAVVAGVEGVDWSIQVACENSDRW